MNSSPVSKARIPSGSDTPEDRDSDEEWRPNAEEIVECLYVSRSHLDKLFGTGVLGDVRRTNDGGFRISMTAVLAYRDMQRKIEALEDTVANSERLEQAPAYSASIGHRPSSRRD